MKQERKSREPLIIKMTKKSKGTFPNLPYFIVNFLIGLLKLMFWKKTQTYYLLLSMFLLAVALRLVGTYPGYPLIHPDEPVIANATRKIVLHLDFNPENYIYGSLLSIIYAVVDWTFFIPFFFIWKFIFKFQYLLDYGPSNFLHDFFVTLQQHVYISYWARYETAVLSSFIVVVVYFIGKKLFSKEVGFVAAFLTAVNYRHVSSSRFALADAPAAVFGGLAILFIIHMISKPYLRNYLLAGLGVALSLSVKYFTYVLPTFLLAHTYIVFKQKRLSNISKLMSILNKKFILACLVIVIVFFTINLNFFYNFEDTSYKLRHTAKTYGVLDPYSAFLDFTDGNGIYFILVPIRYLLWYGLGWTLIATIIAGYMYCLVKYFRKTVFLSSSILSFLFVFLILSRQYAFVRNYASITPFLLFFPSILIIDISRLVKNKRISLAIIIMLTFAVGFTSFKDSLLSSLYFARDHNLTSAIKWIDKNLEVIPMNISASEDFPSLNKKNIKNVTLMKARGNVENMTISELRMKDVSFAFVGSGVTTLVNGELWGNNKYLTYSFFDKERMASFLKNSYTGLALFELGSYRLEEFVKPFWQSNEPAYFVAKIPNFSDKNKKLIGEYNFNSKENLNALRVFSFIPCKFYKLSYVEGRVNNFSSVNISRNPKSLDKDCSVETQFTEVRAFEIEENRWYKAEGFLKRIGNPSPKFHDATNGFIRLDLYTADNKVIKTYVSGQLKNISEWQTVFALGMAPVGSKYAKVSFQLDQYYEDEEYLIKSFKIYALNDVTIDISQYPYFNKPIPENFYWLLEF